MLGEIIEAPEALRMGLVNRVVPGDRLLEEAEAVAKRLAALPAKAVQTNKLLVNRVLELAGRAQAMEYREDPWFKAWDAAAAGGSSEHMAILREQGWEAFRKSRDAIYAETEARGPGA